MTRKMEGWRPFHVLVFKDTEVNKHIVKILETAMRNSLKTMITTDELKANPIFDKRPEQLGVDEFVMVVRLIGEQGIDKHLIEVED